MSFKNSASSTVLGFSLIEVMIAIAVFAIVMSPLFILQGSTYTRLVRGARDLHRMWFAQEVMQRTQEKIKSDTISFTVDESKEFPKTALRYEISHVTQDSPFASLKDLYVESVSLRWSVDGKDRADRLVTFVFKPQPKKQEKK